MEFVPFDRSLSALNCDESFQSPVLAKMAIENLSTIFQGDLTSTEITVYTACIFNSYDGILKFISCSASYRGTGDGKLPIREAFDLLQYVVKNFNSQVELMAKEVTNWCVRFLNNANAANEYKNLSMKLMLSVLNECPCYQVEWEHLMTDAKRFLANSKKTPPTLMEPIFDVIGNIFKLRPDIVSKDKDWFFKLLETKMNEFNYSKNISDSLLIACFKGLSGLLVNFPPSYCECSKIIYVNLKISTTLKEGERNTVSRTALQLFSDHSGYFKENIYNDYKDWHSRLLTWIDFNRTAENKNAGFSALVQFYKVISTYLNDQTPDDGVTVFNHFHQHFEKNCSGEFYRLRDKFAGLCEFFELYEKYECKNKLGKTLNQVINIVHTVSQSNPSILGMQLAAISKMQGACRNGHRLCKLAVTIFQAFPKVEPNFQPHLLECLEKSFLSWYSHSKNDTKLWLDTFCYQSLLLCCAYPIYIDVQLLDEDKKQISYKSYVKLWQYLLTISSRCSHSASPTLGKMFYTSFINNCVKIINKLDLSLNTIVNESSDPSIAKQAKNPNDFQILVNLVDLFQDVIATTDNYQMRNLMSEFLHNISKFSQQYPLVSGFYKMLSTCFKISTNEDLLQPNDIDDMIGYVKRSVQRLNLQKDDLLIANLRMILVAPIGVISNIISELDSVILTGARVGRNYPDILELIIDAMELWNVKLQEQEMEPLLRKVLPSLSSILLDPTNPQWNNPQDVQDKPSSVKTRGLAKKKLIGPTDKKIAMLQQKLLLLLGKLEPLLSSEILEPSVNNEGFEGSELNYKVPLPDARILISLNSLLPRIMELATNCTERSVRVTACELLHAVVLIGIARTREPLSNVDLLRQMLRASLILSCDSDIIIRDMFSPLLIQITHYFSSQIHFNSKEAAVLIEILMEGVTHTYNYALRDFSAVCLREFLVWSVRQLSPELFKISPFNTQAVLRMICNFALHPDRSKRIGATLAFNRLYNEFREDRNILDLFWLRLLYCFCCNLEQCTCEEDAEIVLTALNHIQRPLLQQSAMFLSCPPNRRIPPGMNKGTLEDIAIFSFNYCKSSNPYLREWSQGFVKKILLHLPNKPTLVEFVKNNNLAVDFNVDENEGKNIEANLHYVLWLINEGTVNLEYVSMNVDKLSVSLLKRKCIDTNCTEKLLKCLLLIVDNLSADLVDELAKLMTQRKCLLDEGDIDSGFVQLLSRLKDSSRWLLFISKLPAFDEDNFLTCIDSPSCTNYIWIWHILNQANCLSEYYSGDRIMTRIFNALFKKKGSRMFCVSLEKRIFEDYKKIVSYCTKHELSSQLVIELLSDDSDVYNEENKLKRGQYFFECFKDNLVPFLVSQQDTIGLLRLMNAEGITWVIYILRQIRDNNYKRNVDDFIFQILNEWRLWVQVTSNKWQLFEVVRIISEISNIKRASDFVYFSSWFYDTPNDPDLEVEDMLNFFELLPNFVSYLETENNALSKALAIFDKKWLFFKKGINKDGPNYSNVKAIIAFLMMCLKTRSSLEVWKFTIGSLAQTPSLVSDHLLQQVVLAHSTIPMEHLMHIQEILYKFVFIDLVERQSVNFVESWMSSFLKASVPVNIKFCEQFLPRLLSILENPLSERRERDLVRKIAATNIVHTIYSIIRKEDRIKIQEVLFSSDPKNKDIWPKIIKACEFGRMKSKDFSTGEKNLLRLLNCACVNFMCLYVSLAPEEKFYGMFLFRRGLWESVVDESRQYHLSMDFNKMPSVKIVSTSITNNQATDRKESCLKYAQSHASTLFLSSLSEDVRNFDLTNASITQARNTSINEPAKIALEMEQDALNEHEVVPMICAIIRHMDGKQYNSWLRHLLSSLENSSKNVKLIILKIIHNVQDIVKQFSNEAAPIVLKNIVQLFTSVPVNYLFVDLISMLLEWKPDLSDERKNMTGLVEHLVSKIESQRRDVIKFIFGVVKNIVEQCKHVLVSSQLCNHLIHQISSTITDDLNSYIYINFASILLVNDLFSAEIRDYRLLQDWLQKAMANKKNCQMAAEVCGQLLEKCHQHLFFASIYDEVIKYIGGLQKSDVGNDVTLLYNIHKFFPNICRDFVSVLISRGWHDRSHQKQLCLEMILCYVTGESSLLDPELVTCFKPFAIDVLVCNIVPAQVLILKIILKVFLTLPETTVLDLMEQIMPLCKNKSTELRSISGEVLMTFFQSYKDKELSIANAEDITLLCKAALIDLINDPVDKLQKRCMTFWCDLNMPKTCNNRLVYILTELISIDAEAELVEYGTRLLLQGTSMSPDYNAKIFDHPLEDCSYRELNLLVSWRARYSSLAPMFVPSIATELGRLHMEVPESSSFHLQLRETARSLMFTPTLSESNESPAPQESETSQVDSQFKKPKRPIRFNRNTSSAYFAKRASAANDRTKTRFEERLKERDSNVTLYRSYRVGDFPDIEIKNSQFIDLLVELVGKDSQFAKELFLTLLSSIIKENHADEVFNLELANGLNYVLKHGNAFNAVSISAVFQIAIAQRIVLDATEVCRVARPSNLLSAGVLLLEGNIDRNCSCSDGPTPKRRRSDTNKDPWIPLAEFYHEMRDFDALRGVFLDKLHVSCEAKNAIINETLMNWSTAAESYEAVLKDCHDFGMRNFFNQSYLNCLANLSDWEKLKQCVDGTVESNPGQLWSDTWCSTVVLPLYLKAEMMLSLSSGRENFQDVILQSQKEPQKAKQLSLFAEDVTVAYWLSENVGKTVSYMHKCFDNFLNKWSNTSQWDKQLKLSLLQNLQIICEVHCVTTISTFCPQMQQVSDVMKLFGRESPSKQSNLLLWDLRTNLRTKLLNKLENRKISDLTLISDQIVETNLNLLQASLEQNNVSLAKKYVEIKSLKINDIQKSRWRCLRDLYMALKVKKSNGTCEQKLRDYCNILNKIEVHLENGMLVDEDQTNTVQPKQTILNIVSDMVSLCESNNMNCSNVEELPYEKCDLQKLWLKCAEATIVDNCDIEQIGNTYLKMVKFFRNQKCDKYENIVKCLLKSMQCGNLEAMELFALVTTMGELEESEEILHESCKVPTWMFLKWRQQFVAQLANNPKVLIKNILKRIAHKYPTALSYGLRITKENFSQALNDDPFVKELSSLVLNNPVEECFVEAIGKLANPFIKIKYYIEKINSLLQEDFNVVDVKKHIHNMFKIVRDSDLTENYRTLVLLVPHIEKLNQVSDVKEMNIALQVLLQTVKSADNKKNVNKISNFSKWLAKFSWLKEGKLEIPGQYDGLTKPKPHEHACVAFIKPDLMVMKSQRQPIKITMVGSNAKEYGFLVKFGEDIRQDERIQQIFAQMNSTMRANKISRHLQIDGYSVIPLSSSYGLIQWVDSVTSFNQLMDVPREQINRVVEKHISLLDKNFVSVLQAYHSAIAAKSNSELQSAFYSCVNQFDGEALRNGLYRLSNSPEKFYWLRTNFASSLGTMNIAHWVLGVGDRHLENMLISKATGRVLGIDFGMAFGFATQFLPLPELVPFRLTPQMVNALKPLNECGWLKQSMISCIRALKDNPHVLLAILEVFVLEPCLDWVEQAKRLAKEQDESTTWQVQWYGQSKVKVFKQKLMGGNPIKLIENDLECGRVQGDGLLRLKGIVAGTAERTRNNQHVLYLEPELQVEALLDLATDPLVLSLTYVGWSPWL